MKLQAQQAYSQSDFQNTLSELDRRDQFNFKKRQDVRLENNERLILKSPNGSLWSIEVSNAGTLSASAL